MSNVKEVPDRDKPFYLAILITAVFVTIFMVGAYGVLTGNTAISDYVAQYALAILTIVSMAFTWYYKEKSSK